MKQFNRSKGTGGEVIATAYLEQRDFTILKTNFKTKLGEIDIIAMKNDVIHFIEVKYRAALGFGHGRESVTYGKQQTIRKVATQFLMAEGLYNEIDVSFDVIDIVGDLTYGNYDITFLQGCF